MKTLGAIVAAFVVLFGGDYLLHSVILKSSYMATSDLWRTDAAMMHRMWMLVLAQLLFVIVAVVIYKRGAEKKPWVGQGIRFGILLALLAIVPNGLTEYVVTPLPHRLAMHMMLGDSILAILVALVIAMICQPSASEA